MGLQKAFAKVYSFLTYRVLIFISAKLYFVQFYIVNVFLFYYYFLYVGSAKLDKIIIDSRLIIIFKFYILYLKFFDMNNYYNCKLIIIAFLKFLKDYEIERKYK